MPGRPRIGVAGAGTMGAGIALVSARAGFETVLFDMSANALQVATRNSEAFLVKSAERGRLKDGPSDIMRRVHTTTAVEGLAAAELVIEAVFEDLAVKTALLHSLDGVCSSNAIFATNTSTLSVTEIAAGSVRPERVVGMHFCLPAPRMKLVEMVRGLRTADEAFERAWDLCTRMGQEPVATLDEPGFILNHFVVPYHNHAIRMVAEGVAAPQEIDVAVREGLGYAVGPLELLDLVGLDTQVRLSEALYARTRNPNATAPPLLRTMVAAGFLGKKSGRGFYTYSRPGALKVMSSFMDGRLITIEHGRSRCFPTAVPERLSDGLGGNVVHLHVGTPGRLSPDPSATVVLIELGDECLGEHTGEDAGEEGGNAVGFSRFWLSEDAPTRLVELVTQPHTEPSALAAARTFFQALDFVTAVCRDFPGRIANRLLIPFLNQALAALDEGRGSARHIDQIVRLGLGHPEGPIERVHRTGLARHTQMALRLYELTGDRTFYPARRALIAQRRAEG